MGFAELESNGHIDCFYLHHAVQKQEIATLLMITTEAKVRENDNHGIYAEVTITVKPFFLNKAFVLLPKVVSIKAGEDQRYIQQQAPKE